MDNIILIGMPGVGKSTLGVILAKVLGYKFIDTDLIIQENEKLLLSQIIAKYGVDGFINKENNIVSKIDVSKTVIATGGSVVYGFEAMKNLKRLGKVVYIKQDFDRIKERVENIQGRGVVLKEYQSFLDLYNERIPLYEMYADIIVEQENKDVEDTLNDIIKII